VELDSRYNRGCPMTVSVDEKAAITATCQAFIDTVLKLRFLPVITPTRFNYPKTIWVDNVLYSEANQGFANRSLFTEGVQ